MPCPDCASQHIRKNGHRVDKPNYICVKCGRQFIDFYDTPGYNQDTKALCLKKYVNGMGFQRISRVTGVAHSTIIHWREQVGKLLPDTYDSEVIPEIGELDE